MTWYAFAGSQLAEGAGYVVDGVPTAYWPPGYPAFLALILAAGGGWLTIQVVQVLLSAATCLVTYWVGAQLLGRNTGLIAAAALATSPDHVMYAPLLMSETLFTFVFTSVALAYSHSSRRSGPLAVRSSHCIALGMLVAIAALIRGVALVLPLALIGAWLWVTHSPRITALRGAFVLVGLAATLAPWTLRNVARMGYPIVLGSQVAEVLTVAHWPKATGCLPSMAGDFDAVQRQQHESDEYRIRLDLKPPALEVETMRAETSRALAYMLHHPQEELALVPARIRCLYHDGHSAMRWGRYREAGAMAWEWNPLISATWDAWITRVSDLHFFALLGLAGVGLFQRRSWAGASAFVPLVVVFTTALHAVVLFGDPRFHIPLLPFISLLAASPLSSFGSPRAGAPKGRH
ncbi:MAG TPA: glycosyltransferase family 39 protein [Myxococcota bacterium]|nr:glycosyltransferase family 39 protein [Myxococcota bacterium]